MKEKKQITGLIFMACVIIGPAARSQFFEGDHYTRILVGMNVLSAFSEDPAYTFLGHSSKMVLPSVRFESDPVLIEGQTTSFVISGGFGLVPRGFRYELSPDTVLTFKEGGMNIYAGIGLIYEGIESGAGTHTLSAYLYGLCRFSMLNTTWINDEKVSTNRFNHEVYQYTYGLSSRILFTVIDRDSWKIDLFHAADYIIKDFTLPESLFPYRSLINSAGLCFRFASAYYVPYRRR